MDLNAHLHGNWTLANAKSRLHQYLQQNRIPADFKYSAGGPDHNRYTCCSPLFVTRLLSRNADYFSQRARFCS